MIEYAPQGGVDHIHTIYRDPTNDYGAKFTQEVGAPRGLLAVTAVIAGAPSVSAHRRDEYLQAARLAIDPGGVQLELDLTPGIALAETIIADIDRNRDGALSADEQRAYGDAGAERADARSRRDAAARAARPPSSFPDLRSHEAR